MVIPPLVSRATATKMPKNVGENTEKNIPFRGNDSNETSTEPYCYVKADSVVNLKDSTKKLLYLLEDIQQKSRAKLAVCELPKNSNPAIKPIPCADIVNSEVDISASALKTLEMQTQLLHNIPTADEDDDCSIFKKLSRKCNCLNQQQYNDFVIHFNEATKYHTSTSGEIIKNLRILKRFLYMGGDYAKHALMFLNEGLEESSCAEKIEIIQGCAHADMCNVFEDHSLVITCIAWPYKYESYGDSITQELAAQLIYKLALTEEGRRYLKYTSKITNDIKKVLKKKGSKLQNKTLESLHAILNEMHPKNYMNENITDTFYRKPDDEGFGNQIMKALIYYRQYMTLGEILTHLDLLNQWSKGEKGKIELKNSQNTLMELFKNMLITHNDSEMNVIVADILNNLFAKRLLEEKEKPTVPKIITIADTATEPKKIQNECFQKTKKNIPKRNTTQSKGRNGKHNVIVIPLEK